jgi:hypothetical protein
MNRTSGSGQSSDGYASEVDRRIGELEAHVEALEGALREIAEDGPNAEDAATLARAALAGTEHA